MPQMCIYSYIVSCFFAAILLQFVHRTQHAKHMQCYTMLSLTKYSFSSSKLCLAFCFNIMTSYAADAPEVRTLQIMASCDLDLVQLVGKQCKVASLVPNNGSPVH